MVIVGFAFNKIVCERKESKGGNIKINNNISLTDVEEKELTLGKDKQKGIRFLFEFVSKYDPGLGEIKLIGEVMYMEDQKKIKEIMASWKKDKKVPKEVMTPIFNNILSKCNIEALLLSREINLPPPIQMPRIEPKEK